MAGIGYYSDRSFGSGHDYKTIDQKAPDILVCGASEPTTEDAPRVDLIWEAPAIQALAIRGTVGQPGT